MAWTEPKTWTAEVLTSSDLNTHLRDNLNALKEPPTNLFNANEGANYTSNSTSFADIDATEGKFQHTITTTGGDLMIGFSAFIAGTSLVVYLDIMIDGVAVAGDDGFVRGSQEQLGFVYLKQSVDSGAHVVKMRWKTNGNTATLYAGAGTASNDVHPQFWVREVS